MCSGSGLALAARCRPAFIVTASAGSQLRQLSLFALADQAGPQRGLVVESPIFLPDSDRKSPHVKKLGPLGWLYSYALLTPAAAALMLAEWVSSVPPGSPRGAQQPPYVVTLFRSRDGLTPTAELSVLGDGTTARVTGAGLSRELDKDTLRTALLGLLSQGNQPT